MEITFRSAIMSLSPSGAGEVIMGRLGQRGFGGDVLISGAVACSWVQILDDQHPKCPPLGKGEIRQVRDALYFHFILNLALEGGRRWYQRLRFDLEHPWSSSFWAMACTVDPDACTEDVRGGEPARVIRPRSDGTPSVSVGYIAPRLFEAIIPATLQRRRVV